MAAEFEVEEGSSIVEIEAADSDYKTETVSDITELICPSCCSLYLSRSCLQSMPSGNTARKYPVSRYFCDGVLSSGIS